MIWLYAVLIVLGTFMAVLGITSTNVAIPKMIAPLNTDIYGIEWVSISYVVATAITILAFNYISLRIGLKRTYIWGLIFFSVGSVLSGISNSLEEMIIFRFAQGIGEGLLIPASQSILFSIFPPEKRGTAMGFYAMAVAFAPGLGPTIGGYIVEYFSWRWIFFMNLPIVLPLIPTVQLFLPEVGIRKQISFNWLSFILIAVSSLSFIIFLSKGESWGWFYSLKTFIFLSLFVLSLLSFALSETMSKHKLIDYSIFKSINYVYAVITFILVYGLIFFQTMYMIPIYFESLRKVPTFQTGLEFLGFAFALALFSAIGGRLSDKIEPKILLLFCQLILFLDYFFFLSHIDYYTPKLHVALYMTLLGAGMGLFFAPLAVLAFRNLTQHQIPIGSAFYNYARLMGASIATALATYNFETGRAFHYDFINSIRTQIVPKQFLELHQMLTDLTSFNYKVIIGQVQTVLAGSYAIQDIFRTAAILSLTALFITVSFLFFFKGKQGKGNPRSSGA